MKWLWMALVASPLVVCAMDTARVKPFARYQSIIDRLPFGEMSTAETLEEATKGGKGGKDPLNLKPDQAQLAQQVQMSGITILPDGGLAVGFSDRGANPPTFHFLRVGAPADNSGWEALKASFAEEWVTLRKQGVEVTVKLGKGAVDPATLDSGKKSADVAVKPAEPMAEKPKTKRPRRRLFRRQESELPAGLQEAMRSGKEHAEAVEQAKASGENPRDYLARLRRRTAEQEQALKAAEDAVKKHQEDQTAAQESEKAAAERRIDIELIKQGGRPRKEINLTKEEEKELIDAGVLSQQ